MRNDFPFILSYLAGAVTVLSFLSGGPPDFLKDREADEFYGIFQTINDKGLVVVKDKSSQRPREIRMAWLALDGHDHETERLRHTISEHYKDIPVRAVPVRNGSGWVILLNGRTPDEQRNMTIADNNINIRGLIYGSPLSFSEDVPRCIVDLKNQMNQGVPLQTSLICLSYPEFAVESHRASGGTVKL